MTARGRSTAARSSGFSGSGTDADLRDSGACGASAAGALVLAFGTGEREHLRYPGDGDENTDEKNRFYAAKEHPELACDGGRTIYVTYVDTIRAMPHLLEVTLA